MLLIVLQTSVTFLWSYPSRLPVLLYLTSSIYWVISVLVTAVFSVLSWFRGHRTIRSAHSKKKKSRCILDVFMGVIRDHDFLSLSFPFSCLCSICFLDLSKYWADISVALSLLSLRSHSWKVKITESISGHIELRLCPVPLYTSLHLFRLNMVSMCISVQQRKKENTGTVPVCRNIVRWWHYQCSLEAK